MRTLVVSLEPHDAVTTLLRGMLCALVSEGGLTSATFATAEQVVAQTQPDLAIVLLAPKPDLALDILHTLRGSMSGELLAVGSASDPRLILRALESGADHYLDQADLEGGLRTALNRIKRKQGVVSPSGPLLAVLSSSGGCGASTLAVNLACVLAQEQGRCGLVDLKPGRGDLAALLDVKPQYTLADLCLNATRLDAAMFERILARHPSGVHLLAAPQLFADARSINTAGVNQALLLARASCPQVVVDLEDCFHEEQVLTLRQATTTLLVTRLDFTALRNARRVLEHFQYLEIPRTRIQLVVNRHGQPNELPIQEAEDALGEKLAHFIPDDPKTVNNANNVGKPVVLNAPTSKVAQNIMQLGRVVKEQRGSGRLSSPRLLPVVR